MRETPTEEKSQTTLCYGGFIPLLTINCRNIQDNTRKSRISIISDISSTTGAI
jgi:hypothetical protein